MNFGKPLLLSLPLSKQCVCVLIAIPSLPYPPPPNFTHSISHLSRVGCLLKCNYSKIFQHILILCFVSLWRVARSISDMLQLVLSSDQHGVVYPSAFLHLVPFTRSAASPFLLLSTATTVVSFSLTIPTAYHTHVCL